MSPFPADHTHLLQPFPHSSCYPSHQLQQSFYENLSENLLEKPVGQQCRQENFRCSFPRVFSISNPRSHHQLWNRISFVASSTPWPSSQGTKQILVKHPVLYPSVDSTSSPKPITILKAHLMPRNIFYQEPPWLHLSGSQKNSLPGHTWIPNRPWNEDGNRKERAETHWLKTTAPENEEITPNRSRQQEIIKLG